MKLNRRNTLIGLGTIVAGGGAALGTGAFSSVEAKRTVNVETSGDADALVGLNIVSAELDDQGTDNVITFDTDKDLNVDAITTFDNAFRVTNNRNSNDGGAISVTIEDSGGNNLVTTDAEGETSSGMYFEDVNSDLDSINPTDSVTVDIVFNLKDETTTTNANDAIPDPITVVVNDVSA